MMNTTQTNENMYSGYESGNEEYDYPQVHDDWEDNFDSDYEEEPEYATVETVEKPVKPATVLRPCFLTSQKKEQEMTAVEFHKARKEREARLAAEHDAVQLEKAKMNWASKDATPVEVEAKEDFEFPSLSAAMQMAAQPKAVKEDLTRGDWKPAPKSKSKAKPKGERLVLDVKTYAQERREQRQAQHRANNPVDDGGRTAAFEKLADKEAVAEKLKFTKMCNSITSGEKCRHGDKCRFAHSLDQLTIRECFFGKGCRFVEMNNWGVYRNKAQTKRCDSKHPGESKEDYYKRTGLNKLAGASGAKDKPTELKLKTKPAPKPVVKSPGPKPTSWAKAVTGREEPTTPVNTPTQEPVAPNAPVKPKRTRKTRWDVGEPVVTKLEERLTEVAPQETVLRVPKELAAQAMEMAIKKGMTNIRVELID